MEYCSKCGETIPEDAYFCPKCGAKTRKGLTVGVSDSSQELKEKLSKMGREIEKAFSLAAKEIEEAFKTAGEKIKTVPTKGNVICTNCGEKNFEDAMFCYNCGKEIRKTK